MGNENFASYVLSRQSSSFRSYRVTKPTDPLPTLFPFENEDQYDLTVLTTYKQTGGEYSDESDHVFQCSPELSDSSLCASSVFDKTNQILFALSSSETYLGFNMKVTMQYDSHDIPSDCLAQEHAPNKYGGFCWQDSYGRGAGIDKLANGGPCVSSSPYGTSKNSEGWCIDNCAPNYRSTSSVDLVCSRNCPSSAYNDRGLICEPRWPTVTGSCSSVKDDRGMATKLYGGRCYHRDVNTNYLAGSVPNVVWYDPCPYGTWEGAGSCWRCEAYLFGGCIVQVIAVGVSQRRRTGCSSGYYMAAGLCYPISWDAACDSTHYSTGVTC